MNKNSKMPKGKMTAASKKPQVKVQMKQTAGASKPKQKAGKKGQGKNLNGALYRKNVVKAASRVFGG